MSAEAIERWGGVVDVQVGSDFLAQCTCGWFVRTRDSGVLDISLDYHEEQAGHHWLTPAEAAIYEC